MNRLIIGSPDKTDLLLRLMQEDFSTGFTLIDSTGTLAEAVADIIPQELTDNTFYLDPSDIDHPPGLNVFQGIHPNERHRLVENICAYFEAMWPNGWGAQSNFILANCLRILLDTPGATFLGVLKLLRDADYVKECLLHCTDPVMLANWNAINRWDAKQHEAAIAPLTNKIGTLLMSPVIRNIVGQRYSTFSLTRGKIIIANLRRGALGDLTSMLLGSLLIIRANTPVYINEFGFYCTDQLISLLPRGGYTVVLSFLDELFTRKQQSATLAIEDKYVFRTNFEDAKRLSFYLGLMNPRVLVELDPREVRTPTGELEPRPVPSRKRLKAIRRRSRACHTRPRAAVEADITRFLTIPPSPTRGKLEGSPRRISARRARVRSTGEAQ